MPRSMINPYAATVDVFQMRIDKLIYDHAAFDIKTVVQHVAASAAESHDCPEAN